MPAPRKNASPPAVPVVRILEAPELEPDVLPSVLREINERQWAAIIQVLIEAKYKAESMLRNDAVFDSHGKVSYYQGWVAYGDYLIGSLETLRETEPIVMLTEPEPGPE
jgi:hypothetical protein